MPTIRLRDLFRLLGSHRRPLLVALVLGLVGSGLALTQPLLAMRAVNAVVAQAPVRTLMTVLLVLFLTEAVVSGVQSYVLARTGEALVLRLRLGLLDRLLRLRMSEYDRLRTGDLLSRVGTDTTLLRTVVSTGVIESVASLFSLVGAVALMIWLDWFMFVLVAAVVVVSGVMTLSVLVGVRRYSEEVQERVGGLTADLERVLSAIRTVRASRAEDRERDRVGERAREAYRAGVRLARLDAMIAPAMSVAANGSFLLVLGLGGVRVASGAMPLGELVAFLLYLMFLVMPLIAVFHAASSVQKGMAALQRIEETAALELEPTADGPAVPLVALSSVGAGVELRDVWFSYQPDRPALRGLSLTVPPNAHVALVGPSGAGKSTVFALVERFYDVDDGAITVAGHDVDDLDPAALRGLIGYVQQDAPLLFGSLRDNISYAVAGTGASDDEIDRVVRQANLDDLVARLPDGLNTEVGERGSQLSGGERQRVAIARALLPGPRLLLLDEPTSQLDAANEESLAEVVRSLAGSCTVLTIAHRISTVRNADLIVVLDQGRVVAEGTHESLLETNDLYRSLAARQLLATAPA